MIAERGRRLGFKMNPFDAVNPNHYMGLNFYLALRQGVCFQEVFIALQVGLRRAFQIIPELDGKMMHASEHEFGYKKASTASRSLLGHCQPFWIRDSWSTKISPVFFGHLRGSFERMRDAGFAPSLFKDEIVLDCHPFPAMPADILVAQANFVEGGCILAINFIHTCLDGIGVMVALRVWAECCRYLQGDQSVTCGWFDLESFNHSLPEILHEQEGYSKAIHEVDPGVWGYLPFFPPDKPVKISNNHENRDNSADQTGERKHVNAASMIGKSGPLKENLSPAPVFPRQPVWPAAPAKQSLSTAMLLIPPENIQKLKEDVPADPKAKGLITSVSDIVQAFFWRASIRSRYQVATEIRGKTFRSDELSILELPIDGRPYFSSSLPSSYMGSMLILNRPVMAIETLCSPDTSIGQIAYLIRQAAARITPSLVHDAFTLLQSMSDYTKPATANMGIEHMNVMISNLMLFQTSEISFGEGLFAGKSPEAMRPQIERGHQRFRFLVISPPRKDGGVELVLGTLPEELKMLKSDEEFTRYAKLVDSQ